MTPRVPDHVGVREVEDRKAVAPGAERRHGLGGELARAHLRLLVVRPDLARRRDQDALLPLVLVLDAAVEEVRDVRVLLCLGGVELGHAGRLEHVRQDVRGTLRTERDRARLAGPVRRHRGQERQWCVHAVEAVELRIGEGGADLPRAVGPEVEEDELVTGADAPLRRIADHGRLEELVGHARRVPRLDRRGRVVATAPRPWTTAR
jgi:hypothetical protein